MFAQSELAIDDVRLRLITIDSAYVTADWTMRGRASGAAPDSAAISSGTLVFVAARQGSSWRVFFAQVTGRTDAA